MVGLAPPCLQNGKLRKNTLLPDILKNNLKIVFCGTAAGDQSAKLRMYYAGPGNKFWKILHETGLTADVLEPSRFADLPLYGIGLTDLVKFESGMDSEIDFKNKGDAELRDKMLAFRPRILCFNGKRAAQEFLAHTIDYGLQTETIGATKLFVAPSTSGAANGFWDSRWWHKLAELALRKGE